MKASRILYVFPFLYSLVVVFPVFLFGQEIFFLIALGAWFLSSLFLFSVVSILNRFLVVEDLFPSALAINRFLFLLLLNGFFFFYSVTLLYALGGAFHLDSNPLFFGIPCSFILLALVWRPVNIDERGRHFFAMVCLGLIAIGIAIFGIVQGNKFKREGDMLYQRRTTFQSIKDCDVFSFDQFRSECLGYYAENSSNATTENGNNLKTECPEKIDSISFKCYAKQAIHEQNFEICSNNAFLKFYKDDPYRGWLDKEFPRYAPLNTETACKMTLARNVASVSAEYYYVLPIDFVSKLLSSLIPSVCSKIERNDMCMEVVSNYLSNKFYAHFEQVGGSLVLRQDTRDLPQVLDASKKVGSWIVRYPSTLLQSFSMKDLYDKQLKEPGTSFYAIGQYETVKASILEHLVIRGRGEDDLNLVLSDRYDSQIVSYIFENIYLVDSGQEDKVAEFPFVTNTGIDYKLQVYKYGTSQNPGVFKVIYVFTDGKTYLSMTSKDKELGYQIAQSVGK